VSEDARDLIRKLLVKEPTKRIALKQIKYHRWIVKNMQRSDDPSKGDKENINS
jgi:SNF1-activating kinase 1